MNVTIKRTGANTFEVSHHDGLLTVLVSYSTPVAVKNAEGRVSRTKTRWSRSTEKHIRDFQRAGTGDGGCWLQENLDRALEELIGTSRLLEKTSAAGRLGREWTTYSFCYDEYTEPGDKNLAIPPQRHH